MSPKFTRKIGDHILTLLPDPSSQNPSLPFRDVIWLYPLPFLTVFSYNSLMSNISLLEEICFGVHILRHNKHWLRQSLNRYCAEEMHVLVAYAYQFMLTFFLQYKASKWVIICNWLHVIYLPFIQNKVLKNSFLVYLQFQISILNFLKIITELAFLVKQVSINREGLWVN